MNSALVTLPQTVLQPNAAPDRSERFVHIDSREVIRSMEAEGFEVANVTVAKSRVRDPLYLKHSVSFRRPDFRRDDRRGGYVPQVLFTNAHDGTAQASFMMGVYAFVCSNGLVIGSTYAQEKVRHIGEQATTLIARMSALAKNTAPLFDQIDAWQQKQLTTAQAREFARLASVLRWGDPHRFDAAEVLRVRREEDDAGDLWTVFNRVQENTVRGGLIGLSRSGRASTSRPLSEITASTEYNRQLWSLAEDFAAL